MISIFRERCIALYQPSSNASIDVVVLCCGRSRHTYKMPNKPIDQGCKIFALADSGYIYTFTPASRSVTSREDLDQCSNNAARIWRRSGESSRYSFHGRRLQPLHGRCRYREPTAGQLQSSTSYIPLVVVPFSQTQEKDVQTEPVSL